MAVLLPTDAQSQSLTWEEDLRRSVREFVRLLPAAAATGLGTLYLVGAITKIAQLQQAKVSLVDALPLIPLQQLLALSLPTVVTSAFLLPLVVLLYPVIPRATDGAVRQLARRLARPKALAIAVVLACVLLWQMFTAAPLLVVCVFACLVVAGRLSRRPVVAAVAVYGVFFAAVIASTYLYPTPLPVANIRTVSGQVERGRLVAATDSAWYVVERANTITTVPTSRMARSTVVSGHAPRAKTIWTSLLDLVR